MNKKLFFKICDEELAKRIKELPVLENLSNMYSKQAFVLMIYSCFEGFINTTTLNFFELLKNECKRGMYLNAHYSFCVDLYCKKNEIDKDLYKTIWRKFRPFKDSKCFHEMNNRLVDTNDNLGYDGFKYLLFILNISEYKPIDSAFYSKTLTELRNKKERNYLYYKDIINGLLTKRNDIAHGNSKIFDKDFLTQEIIETFSTGILTIMKQFKNDLEEIIENDLYFAKN